MSDSIVANIFSLRRDRHALRQLLLAITHKVEPNVGRCAEFINVMEAWDSIKMESQRFEALIQELKNELQSTRSLLNETAASASATKARFDLFSRASKDGLWDMEIVAVDPINPKNRFWCSQQFWDLLGFMDEQDLPNVLASWSDRIHPDDKQAALEALVKHLNDRSGQTTYRVKCRLMLRDGTYRWFSTQGDTLRDDMGTPVRMAGSIRDLHDDVERDSVHDVIITRFELAREMLTDGLWDMEIKAADPTDPKNLSWWCRNLGGYLDLKQ